IGRALKERRIPNGCTRPHPAPKGSNDAVDPLARPEGADVGDDAVEETLPRLAGAPGGVRGDQEIVEPGGTGREEGMVGGRRLGGENIDGGSADGPGPQGGDEVILLDEIAASGVDENGVG